MRMRRTVPPSTDRCLLKWDYYNHTPGCNLASAACLYACCWAATMVTYQCLITYKQRLGQQHAQMKQAGSATYW
jgi:hypothetical protein